MTKKIAFQGEHGAYSEEASIKALGNVETLPCRTLSDVFKNVEAGDADGIVPVENSIEGSITRTYDLLKESTVQILKEVILHISHCLIVNPGTEMGSIKEVYSHPQALAQCEKFLAGLNCEVIPTYDTAGSIQIIKEKKNSAAIASRRAAEMYGMEILMEGIQSSPENYTRFFVISDHDSGITGDDKTSIVFSIAHRPGSLHECLGAFAREELNLTKIESRPIVGQPWSYSFYIDFEGHRSEEKAKKALKDVKRKTKFLKILGSYPKWAIK